MRSTNVQENLHYSEFETYRKNYDTWGMHICEVKIDSEQNQDMGLHLLDGSSHRAVWSVDVNVNLRRLIIRKPAYSVACTEIWSFRRLQLAPHLCVLDHLGLEGSVRQRGEHSVP